MPGAKEILDIQIDPKLQKVIGKFTPEERQRIQADFEYAKRNFLDSQNSHGLDRACYDTDEHYEQGKRKGAFSIFFNEKSGFAGKDIETLTLGFRKDQGKIILDIIISDNEKIEIPIEFTSAYPEVINEETQSNELGKWEGYGVDIRDFKDFIIHYHRATEHKIMSGTKDPDKIETLDRIRKAGHLKAADLIQDAARQHGVDLGRSLINGLFELIAHQYPNKGNPFPVIAAGRNPEF